MILSRDLKGVEAIYEDQSLRGSEGYWFSYKNAQGAVLHAFRDRLLLAGPERSIPFDEMDEASLHVPNVRSAATCAIDLKGRFGEIRLPVDTVSKEQFLDVFPVQKALARHILLAKRERSGGKIKAVPPEAC